jgi:hypothetical protein
MFLAAKNIPVMFFFALLASSRVSSTGLPGLVHPNSKNFLQVSLLPPSDMTILNSGGYYYNDLPLQLVINNI